MNEDLDRKWDEAARTGAPVPIGDLVVCDVCNVDYTASTLVGGFLFGTYAYCPKCAEKHRPKISEYGEEHLIRARARSFESFADFIRRIRGPDATIQITKGPLLPRK